MTHDELLAKISRIVSLAEEACKIEATPAWFETTAMLKALRAVVELHKPYDESDTPHQFAMGWCEGCSIEYSVSEYASQKWPCPTIQAIEKELI